MKTRKIERTRLVPHTVDGETEYVEDTQYIEVSVPPRDWDAAVRTAVTIGAVVLVTASLVWTTTSVGGLLAMATIAVVAYAAGVAFDASWILCMGAEWLLRYDPERAAVPRRAGHFALAISMGAVYAHGQLSGEWVVGAVGAAVSALAKGGWMIAMRVHARPLDPRTQQWVAKRRAAVDGQLAMIPVRRELQRGQALIDAEQRSLTDTGSADPDRPDQSADDPDADVLTIRPGAMNSKDAVRIAWDSGIRDDGAATRYASKVMGKAISPDTVARYMRALRIGA
ncbi:MULTISPECIES: protein transporter Sec31 [unclassified Streptomyces]|uniref:protein transporter Sec31 n=1 Tax=unclassified Streptomyces TaxID=2593676 RepID=UPI000DD98C7F|nr:MULTISPECIES: protein transporter Sec31 [unclassified Streptomyces]QZZ26546.1 protein transporter Sec31 [Streptomyces sp. ST1015]